jgi:dTDP-4-amino-4,6-dideoxygalactose transaminase
MTDLQGAVGTVQMERAAWILAARTRAAERYSKMLAEITWLDKPKVPEGYIHGYQSYVCLFRPEELTFDNAERLHEQRNALMMRLEQKGIATRQGTHAPVILGYYANKYDLSPAHFPNAYLADRVSLTLPLYAQMTEEEQTYVVNQLQQAYSEG